MVQRKGLHFNFRARRASGNNEGSFLGKALAIVPNILTLSAILSGLTSIKLSAEGHFAWAIAAIAGAVVFDVFDGLAARKFNAVSAMGAQLDSLADLVNFGVAPAILLYERDLYFLGWAGWLVAGIYVLSTSVRLARFNVQSTEVIEEPAAKWFQGLPSTGAAVAVLIASGLASLALTPSQTTTAMIVAMIAISGLMVSRISVPSLSLLLGRKGLRRWQF